MEKLYFCIYSTQLKKSVKTITYILVAGIMNLTMKIKKASLRYLHDYLVDHEAEHGVQSIKRKQKKSICLTIMGVGREKAMGVQLHRRHCMIVSICD